MHHGQLTFSELLTTIYSDSPAIQIQQLIRQVAPSLLDNESYIDTTVQDELDRLGEPTIIAGENKQSRRIRLAVSRTVQLPTAAPPHESQAVVPTAQPNRLCSQCSLLRNTTLRLRLLNLAGTCLSMLMPNQLIFVLPWQDVSLPQPLLSTELPIKPADACRFFAVVKQFAFLCNC